MEPTKTEFGFCRFLQCQLVLTSQSLLQFIAIDLNSLLMLKYFVFFRNHLNLNGQ